MISINVDIISNESFTSDSPSNHNKKKFTLVDLNTIVLSSSKLSSVESSVESKLSSDASVETFNYLFLNTYEKYITTPFMFNRIQSIREQSIREQFIKEFFL